MGTPAPIQEAMVSWNIVEDLRPLAMRDKVLLGKAKAKQPKQGKRDKRRKAAPNRKREI